MYNFVDTIDVSEGASLPSEALMINNEYIENLIEGYRTLSVSGREALSPELSYFETGVSDGARMQNKRYPGRTLVIQYQLVAESNEAFRAAYNKLAGILNVTDAELIFADEPDKFFIGTPSSIETVEPGRNAVIGEFEIFCADPFKYSVMEYEATAWSGDESTIMLDYNGTYKAYPTLEADFFDESEVSEDGETAVSLTGKGDCGFVAFFTEDEKIIQLGDPDELDSEVAYAKSQTLHNQLFNASTSWGTAAKNLWAANNGVVLPVGVSQVGSVGMSVSEYEVPAVLPTTSGTLLNRVITSSGAPLFYYTVIATATRQSATTVKVTVSVVTQLKNPGSYIGRPYSLSAYIYIGGAWREIVVKNPSEFWRGQTAHTSSISFTVSGLTATTTAITGIKFKVLRTDSVGDDASGELPERSCNNLTIGQYVASVPTEYYLNPISYGSGSGLHGPSITKTIGADASGDIGATNFTLSYKQKMSIGTGQNDTNQYGVFSCQLTDARGVVVAGINVIKHVPGKYAYIVLYVNGKNVDQVGIDITYYNRYFGKNGVHTSTITKSGRNVTFNIGGYIKTIYDDDITDLKATKFTFFFGQYGTYTPLSYNGIYSAKFVKNNCNVYRDIPNKFSAGDVITADCKKGEIRLNGSIRSDLGALGNDWEKFVLTPGLNMIGFTYSDWVNSSCAPTAKVKYREVFL